MINLEPMLLKAMKQVQPELVNKASMITTNVPRLTCVKTGLKSANKHESVDRVFNTLLYKSTHIHQPSNIEKYFDESQFA